MAPGQPAAPPPVPATTTGGIEMHPPLNPPTAAPATAGSVGAGSIAADATGTLVNTATVTAPGTVTDPDPGNDTATDTDTLTPEATSYIALMELNAHSLRRCLS